MSKHLSRSRRRTKTLNLQSSGKQTPIDQKNARMGQEVGFFYKKNSMCSASTEKIVFKLSI